MKNPITVKEVASCIKSLKNNKAPGFDAVTGEHLKYGGEQLVMGLVYVFNKMVQMIHIPQCNKVGVIVPIPKGEKDATYQNNNRGITLLPVVGKVFEKVLFERHSTWSKDSDPLDQLQGASQDHCSSIHTTLLLRETVAYNAERNSTVYVAMLDTEKAFDSVWVSGLLYTLYNSGMDPVLWRLLREMYVGFTCYVKVDGKLSEGFEAGQGVHQGAPWSMYLFQKLYDKLIRSLKDSNCNAQIGHLKTGVPTFADDLSVVCLHKPVLQAQLDKIYAFSRKWRLTFNPSKSVLLVFGKDQCSDLDIHLGRSIIKPQSSDEHMGVFIGLDMDQEKKYIQKRIQKARQAFFMSQAIGSRSCPMSPVAMSKLYWTVCIPRMTYGLEVLPLHNSSVENMELAHGSMAKMTQRLPAQTVNASCLAPLGWRSLSTHLDYIKLMFLWRLLLLTTDCIYKQVAIVRICDVLYDQDGRVHLGPISDIVTIFFKYGLEPVLDRALKSGEYMSIHQFKRMLTPVLFQRESACFGISCMLYKSLTIITNAIDRIGMWIWYKYMHCYPWQSHKVRIMSKLLYGQHCLNDVTSHYNKTSPLCNCCDKNVVESVHHFLFDCDHFSEERHRYWVPVMLADHCGYTICMNNMNSLQKTIYIMQGFRCEDVRDAEELLTATVNFCHKMYIRRCTID